MANALLDVIDTFVSLDAQYTMLRIACKTADDLATLDSRYVTAQENAEIVTGQELDDDDKEVSALDTQLKICNTELKKATLQMGNMSKVLDNLTEAVTIGGKLIAMCP